MALKHVFTVMLLFGSGIAKNISSFNITTIAAVNDASVLQCWQITLPLTKGSQVGLPGAVVQSLGNVSAMQWASVPANYAGTAHPAPVVQ